MTDVLLSSPKRPRRAAAQNALYRDCPTCNRKFLITEIEFHVNLCLQKMEKETSKLLSKPQSKKHSPFKVNKKFKTVPKAPEFRPTIEEFKNPLEYIESIRHEAQKFGICKIIPPTSQKEWLGTTLREHVVQEDFFFQTKKQNIRQLARRGVSDEFYCKLTEFLQKNEKELKAIPKISNKRVQLYFLYKEVTALGGYDSVCSQDIWGQVASRLKFAPIPAVSSQLQSVYRDNLYDFEQSSDKFVVPTKKLPVSSSKAGMRAVTAGMQSVSAPKFGMAHQAKPSVKPTHRTDSETDTDTDDSDEESFGFATGRVYSLASFKKQAQRFHRSWFRANGSPKEVTLPQIETEYWNIVENRNEPCRVQYGSDLDVKSHGSGFSADSHNPWNLNILPTLPRSLLRFLPEHVSGITIPMMYVGMTFSTFCWHVEDDYLYSINFLHEGAPKTWYGVSSSYCKQFEQVIQEALPDLFEVQPDLLHHLTTMLSPLDFLEAGVPIVRMDQYPGEFMITFPQAYHGGFNNGFNIAEAVNFATPDWLPFSAIVVKNYQLVKRTHIFSNIELIVNALQLEEHPDSISWLVNSFWTAREEEVISRGKVLAKGVAQHNWPINGPLPHSKPCRVCNSECYLSAIICSCSPGSYSCLDHIEEFCSCSLSEKTLLARYSVGLMDAIIANANLRITAGKRNLILPKSEKI